MREGGREDRRVDRVRESGVSGDFDEVSLVM